MRYIFWLCCFAASLLYGQTDSIFANPEEPPLFAGCDDPLISLAQRRACSQQEMASFLAKNLSYPDSAKAKNIEGVVLVRFVVDAEGNISQTELLRDIGEGCGREALRVVRQMPAFTPARQNGQPVACYFTIPVRFTAVAETEFATETAYSLHWGNVYENTISPAIFAELLEQTIEVRDHYGNTYPLRDIEISVVDGYDVQTEKAYSASRPSSRMRRKFKKIKPGVTIVLTVNADSPQTHERFSLMREYQISK